MDQSSDYITPEMQRYILEVNSYPMLDRDEEQALLARSKEGDEAALKELLAANLRWVIEIAKKFAGSGVGFPTLIRAGNAALLRAAYRDRVALRRIRFISGAAWYVSQAMLHVIDDPTAVSDAEVTPLLSERVLRLLAEAGLTEPIHVKPAAAPVFDPNPTVLNFLYEDLLASLTTEETLVLSLYLGMTGQARTVVEIASELNLSVDEVRAIKQQALDYLRSLEAGD